MIASITRLGFANAPSFGRRRLMVAAATTLSFVGSTDDIVAVTGFKASTVRKEMASLALHGYVSNVKPNVLAGKPAAVGAALPKLGFCPKGVSDDTILSTYRRLGDKQATANALGMKRGGIRHRLDRLARAGVAI